MHQKIKAHKHTKQTDEQCIEYVHIQDDIRIKYTKINNCNAPAKFTEKWLIQKHKK